MKRTLQFQTPADTPPPFCYQVLCEVEEAPEGLKVDFKMHYFGREELTQDEIEMEGFSMDDDFEWEGTLPQVWVKAIKHLESQSNWVEEPVGEAYFSLLDEKENTFFPNKPQAWQMFLQDLIQALHEWSGSAVPLQIQLLEIEKNKKEKTLILPSFVERKVVLKHWKDNKVVKDTKIAWHVFSQLVEKLFLLEFIPEKATTKTPNKNGFYVTYDETLWYQFGKSVALEQAEGTIDELKAILNQ